MKDQTIILEFQKLNNKIDTAIATQYQHTKNTLNMLAAISVTLNALEKILISKGICTEEEFKTEMAALVNNKETT